MRAKDYHIFIPTMDDELMTVIHWSFESVQDLLAAVRFRLTDDQVSKYHIFDNVWQVRVLNMRTHRAEDFDIEALLMMEEFE